MSITNTAGTYHKPPPATKRTTRKNWSRLSALIGIALLVSPQAFAQTGNARWDTIQATRPLIRTTWNARMGSSAWNVGSGYLGGTTVDDRVGLFNSFGLNTICDQDGSTPYDWSSADAVASGADYFWRPTGYSGTIIQDLESLFSSYTAPVPFIGVYITDEPNPYDPTMMSWIHNNVAAIRNHTDPRINSLPILTSAYSAWQANAFMSDAQFRPDAVLFQTYRFTNGSFNSSAFLEDLSWNYHYADNNNSVNALWVQNFGAVGSWTIPTETIAKLQKFAGMTYGAKIIADFAYLDYVSPNWGAGGMLHGGGGTPPTITTLGSYHQQWGREILNVAKSLGILTHQDTGFVTNRSPSTSLPNVLKLNQIDHPGLISATIDVPGGGAYGSDDFAIGYFKDDSAQDYFMITNLANSNQPVTPASLNRTIRLTFDSSITSLLRLNRDTGLVESLPLDGNHTLVLSLDGATGDLFKYDTGQPFAMVPGLPIAPADQPITLLAAGFETAEGYPSSAGGQYDLAPGYLGDPSNQQGWYSEAYYKKFSAPGTAYVSTANPHTGSQSLMLPKTDYYYDYIRHEIAEKTTGVLIAEMWYYLDHVSTAAEPPATHPGKTTNNIYMVLEDRFDADGNEYEYNGPGGDFSGHTASGTSVDFASQNSFWASDAEHVAAGAAAPGAWRGLRVVIDLDSGLFDSYLDAGKGWSLLLQGVPLNSLGLDPNAIDAFRIYQFSDGSYGGNPAYFWGDTDTYVDDILISWAPPGLFGDATSDGKIDSADLAIWQQNYDPLGLNDNTFYMGDWNCDGLIDSADLALWQQNYDPIGTLNVTAAHTPEPATLFVMMAAGLPLLLRRKSRACLGTEIPSLPRGC